MNLENLKILGINIKEYFIDLIVFTLIGFIWHLVFQYFFFTFFHIFALNNKVDLFPLSFEVASIFGWILIFLGGRWLWQEKSLAWLVKKFPDEYRFNNKTNKLTTERFLNEWIFQGNSHPSEGGLLVTNSNSGCLIKPKKVFGFLPIKKIWKNFTANIEIEFPVQQNKLINPQLHTHTAGVICIDPCCHYPFEDYLGIIIRAQSLDDYFMLEVRRIDSSLVVRPHIRINGNWDAPILNIDSNSLSVNKDAILLNLVVKDEVVTLSTDDSSINWLFPTNVDTNLFQQANLENTKKITKNLISEIYFRYRVGMFGFRCYGNQIAKVKSLEIFQNT